MGFSIENIPYGIASCAAHPMPQNVTRHGDDVIFLGVLQEQGLFNLVAGLPESIFAQKTLNAFAGLPKALHRQVRSSIQQILRDESRKDLLSTAKVPITECTLHMPLHIENFTDFSCSKEHNLRAGEIVLGTAALPPAFYQYPLGYTGRASSIMLSGTPVQRPLGLYRESPGSDKVVFGPEKKLDFELEIGCVVGRGIESGAGCLVEKARDHIFGFVLLNDWSARDIQTLEMRPLGPLNGKSFHTTISPWIITSEALEACEIDAMPFEETPARYLQRETRKIPAICLQVEIIKNNEPKSQTVVCKTHSKWLYWTFEDMIAQQTVNGCSLKPGDILSSGTVSGKGDDERGCLLESTRGGTVALTLSDGTKETFLEDGDTVRLTGFATSTSSDVRIDFGECVGSIMPARSYA